jgi:radical SAM protein with 4Fe4S-binding SPASM domain
MILEPLKFFSLYITGRCEQGCKRCYQQTKDSYKTSMFRDYKQLIKFLNQFEFEDEVIIHVIGGEPLLAKDELFNYVKQINKLQRTKPIKLEYLLNTAGGNDVPYLIELLDQGLFEPKNIILTWHGLEGYKYIRNQDLHKKYTSDLQILATKPYASQIRMRTSMTVQTIQSFFQSMQYLLDLGYRNLEYFQMLTFDIKDDKSYIDKCMLQLSHTLTYAINKFPDMSFYNLEKLVWCHITPSKDFSKIIQLSQSVCYHWKQLLLVTVDGDVYHCPLLEGNPSKFFHQYKLGNIYDGIDNHYAEQVITDLEFQFQTDLTKCNDCINYNCNMCKLNRIVFNKYCPDALAVFCEFAKQERLLFEQIFSIYQNTPLIQSILEHIEQRPYLNYEYIQNIR